LLVQAYSISDAVYSQLCTYHPCRSRTKASWTVFHVEEGATKRKKIYHNAKVPNMSLEIPSTAKYYLRGTVVVWMYEIYANGMSPDLLSGLILVGDC
jgi:hypothetical protein